MKTKSFSLSRRFPEGACGWSSLVLERHTKGTEMLSRKTNRETKRGAALREIKKVIPLIDRIKREKPGTDWSGVETCPIYQQRLYIHHFRVSGKSFGSCETPNCVAWW